MTTWEILTRFWFHHDLFFTHFPLYRGWVRWNEHHFRSLPHIHQWFRLHGHRLWGWVNVHG